MNEWRKALSVLAFLLHPSIRMAMAFPDWLLHDKLNCPPSQTEYSFTLPVRHPHSATPFVFLGDCAKFGRTESWKKCIAKIKCLSGNCDYNGDTPIWLEYCECLISSLFRLEFVTRNIKNQYTHTLSDLQCSVYYLKTGQACVLDESKFALRQFNRDQYHYYP